MRRLHVHHLERRHGSIPAHPHPRLWRQDPQPPGGGRLQQWPRSASFPHLPCLCAVSQMSATPPPRRRALTQTRRTAPPEPLRAAAARRASRRTAPNASVRAVHLLAVPSPAPASQFTFADRHRPCLLSTTASATWIAMSMALRPTWDGSALVLPCRTCDALPQTAAGRGRQPWPHASRLRW